MLTAVAALATGLSVLALAVIWFNSQPSHFDDAYMFVRYADHMLSGHGHAWNPGGPQTFGSTSLLHVAAVTAIRSLLPSVRPAWVLLTASMSAAVVGLVLIVVAAGLACRHPLLRRNWLLWAGLLLPGLVMQEVFKYHVRSGMDTMAALACNALLALATLWMIRRPSWPRVACVVAAGYLAFLARPDNGLYATTLPVLALLLMAPSGRLNRFGRLRERLLPAMGFSVVIVAVLFFDAASKRTIFGTALPLPFYAKQHGAYAGYAGMDFWNPIEYLRIFAWVAMPWILVVLLFANRRAAAAVAALLLPVAATFAYFFSINQIMGFEARFYYPALPFVVLAAVFTLDGWLLDRSRKACAAIPDEKPGGGRSGLFEKEPSRPPPLPLAGVGRHGSGSRPQAGKRSRVRLPIGPHDLLMRIMLTMLVVLWGRQATYTFGSYYLGTELQPPAEVEEFAEHMLALQMPVQPGGPEEIVALSQFVRDAPPGTSMVATEYGRLGAAGPQVAIIDVVGLHDPEFALKGFSADALFARDPDVVWMPHPDYTVMIRQILEHPEFVREYEYYPGGFAFGIAVRKDAPNRERLMELLRRSWQMLYGDRPMVPADPPYLPLPPARVRPELEPVRRG